MTCSPWCSSPVSIEIHEDHELVRARRVCVLYGHETWQTIATPATVCPSDYGKTTLKRCRCGETFQTRMSNRRRCGPCTTKARSRMMKRYDTRRAGV